MSYTYSDLKLAINNRLHGKIGRVYDLRSVVNDAVRSVRNDVRMESLKRVQSSPTRLYDEIYDYAAPSDMGSLVDAKPVLERSISLEWALVAEADFDRRKSVDTNLLCVASDGGTRSIRASIDPANDVQVTLSTLDSITSGGTITAFGDATNVATDGDDYVKGNGAVKFDCAGAGTTAGLSCAMSSATDITEYVNAGQAFAWVYLSSITGLSSVGFRIGSDSSNYYLLTATSAHNSTSFAVGWNLVSLNFSSKTTVGTPVDASCDYWTLYLNKTAVAGTGFRMDNLILALGEQFSIVYYSEYPWKTSGGTWIANSTADTDILNAGEEEYDLIVKRCTAEIAPLVKEMDDATLYAAYYKSAKENYQSSVPDESLVLETDSYRWDSVG